VTDHAENAEPREENREHREHAEGRGQKPWLAQQYAGEVARRYQYLDGAGEIGFISSVTEPFCGACSRARLSADGVLYTCLFANTGTSLRDPMRNGANDEELGSILRRVWNAREDRYSELRQPIRNEQPLVNKVEMYRIGG
jgi:cyclic pyranopterin phosphate synthase